MTFQELNKRLVEILGLPPMTRLVEIRFEAGKAPFVQAEIYVQPETLAEIVTELHQFELQPRARS